MLQHFYAVDNHLNAVNVTRPLVSAADACDRWECANGRHKHRSVRVHMHVYVRLGLAFWRKETKWSFMIFCACIMVEFFNMQANYEWVFRLLWVWQHSATWILRLRIEMLFVYVGMYVHHYHTSVLTFAKCLLDLSRKNMQHNCGNSSLSLDRIGNT